MVVDVQVETVIAREPAVVAAYAGDPSNAPQWYANIASVQWRTEPPVRVGSELDFVAHFMGRRLTYTYRVVELTDDRVVMETAHGPFPMRTTYAWESIGTQEAPRTRMRLRNTGEPRGFARMSAPLVAAAMKRATTKDLARLKALLER